MENSVLDSTKMMLGIETDENAFDADIVTSINSAFEKIRQLGVGPKEGFFIEDNVRPWSEFSEFQKERNAAKFYVYLYCKKAFDPPSSTAIMDSINNQLSEWEWRLSVMADGSF